MSGRNCLITQSSSKRINGGGSTRNALWCAAEHPAIGLSGLETPSTLIICENPHCFNSICILARLKEVLRITREHQAIFQRPARWYVREYLNFHLPRWRRHRKPWKDRLVVVPEDFFYEGIGVNPFA